MQTLQAGIELLDDAAGKKTMLEDEFVEKGTMEWLARRYILLQRQPLAHSL